MTLERFASYEDLRLICQRIEIAFDDHDSADVVSIRSGIDPVVWSLNGDHFASTELRHLGDVVTCDQRTFERGTQVFVASTTVLGADHARVEEPDFVGSGWFAIPDADGVVRITTFAAVARRARPKPSRRPRRCPRCGPRRSSVSMRYWLPAKGTGTASGPLRMCASTATRRSSGVAFLDLSQPHRAAGPQRPSARRRTGLSCQAYQGAAFWDQEMFNLPAFSTPRPTSPGNLLVYRWRTLDGARRKARRLGYEGAFYAWISGDTGDELCPDFFFADVLTGRPIRNHFNVWQIHVSPDIAHAVWTVLGRHRRRDFIVDHGAEIVFEVARFLRSFVPLGRGP